MRRLCGLRQIGTVCFAIASAAGELAYADEPLDRGVRTHAGSLGLFADVAYLGSPGAAGAVLDVGLRLGIASHLAGSFDFGYGLMSSFPGTQDRWWAILALACVTADGPVRFEIGAGAGVGTSSGYTSWPDYVAGPFSPVWHLTVPAVRAHAVATTRVTRSLDVFARIDFGSLLFTSSYGVGDTLWFDLGIGIQYGLL
jgi:hypothetical protein